MDSLANLEDFVEINEALAHEAVSYSGFWIRSLASRGRIPGRKIGSGRRGQWLVHLPSLLAYINEMDNCGAEKHSPN